MFVQWKEGVDHLSFLISVSNSPISCGQGGLVWQMEESFHLKSLEMSQFLTSRVGQAGWGSVSRVLIRDALILSADSDLELN